MMNASDTERSTVDLPATTGATSTAANRQQPDTPVPATAPRSKPLPTTHADWPLPPPISETKPGNGRPKAKPRHELVELSTADEKALAALQERCKEVGIKIKKNKLLTAGLQMLAAAPTGKLLAILGPLESSEPAIKIKKKKLSPRT